MSKKEATAKPKRRFMPVTLLDVHPLSESKQSLIRSLQLIISALTLVAGLAWNEAIRNFINQVLEPAITRIFDERLGELTAIITPFIYAVIITFIVVFVVNRVQKLEERLEKSEETGEKDELDKS